MIYSISSSGCLNEPEPHANIQFKISIWTDENATLYLPLPLDLPNYTVSDLVSLIEVSEIGRYRSLLLCHRYGPW